MYILFYFFLLFFSIANKLTSLSSVSKSLSSPIIVQVLRSSINPNIIENVSNPTIGRKACLKPYTHTTAITNTTSANNEANRKDVDTSIYG